MDPSPLRAAITARDLDAVVDALADDVVFYSPVIKSPPFEGKASVRWIFDVALTHFDPTVTHEFADGDVSVYLTEGSVLGEPFTGAFVMRLDDAGKVREIKVHIRPVRALARITLVVAKGLAQLRGGAAGKAAVAAGIRPYVGYADTVTRVGGRLIGHLNRVAK